MLTEDPRILTQQLRRVSGRPEEYEVTAVGLGLLEKIEIKIGGSLWSWYDFSGFGMLGWTLRLAHVLALGEKLRPCLRPKILEVGL